MIPSRLSGDYFNPHKLARLHGWSVSPKSWGEDSPPWHRCVRLRIGTKPTVISHPIQLSPDSAVALHRLMSHMSAVCLSISTRVLRRYKSEEQKHRDEIQDRLWAEISRRQTREMLYPDFFGPGSKKG